VADNALKITQDGTTINVNATPVAPTALPLNAAGGNPRFVRAITDTGAAYVKVGGRSLTDTLTPTLNSTLVSSQMPIILDVKGMSLINAITRSSSCNLNVVPIEE